MYDGWCVMAEGWCVLWSKMEDVRGKNEGWWLKAEGVLRRNYGNADLRKYGTELRWIYGTTNLWIHGRRKWLIVFSDWNVKFVYKEQFCSKNIWRIGTKMLPLHHISQINNYRLWSLVNSTSYSKSTGGEKMEVAGTNIMCILTTKSSQTNIICIITSKVFQSMI